MPIVGDGSLFSIYSKDFVLELMNSKRYENTRLKFKKKYERLWCDKIHRPKAYAYVNILLSIGIQQAQIAYLFPIPITFCENFAI
jgi:hypothetical protein